MLNTDLIIWIICTSIQTVFCLIMLYIEEDRQTFKEIIGWLLIGITPISMFIVIGIGMILLLVSINFISNYIGNQLFNLIKKK